MAFELAAAELHNIAVNELSTLQKNIKFIHNLNYRLVTTAEQGLFAIISKIVYSEVSLNLLHCFI